MVRHAAQRQLLVTRVRIEAEKIEGAETR